MPLRMYRAWNSPILNILLVEGDSMIGGSGGLGSTILNSFTQRVYRQFVQHEDKMAGIIAVSQLLENYKSEDMSGSTIREYMEPLLTIKDSESEGQAAEIMAENDVDFMAVTNQNGVFLGVVSSSNLNSQPSSL